MQQILRHSEAGGWPMSHMYAHADSANRHSQATLAYWFNLLQLKTHVQSAHVVRQCTIQVIVKPCKTGPCCGHAAENATT